VGTVGIAGTAETAETVETVGTVGTAEIVETAEEGGIAHALLTTEIAEEEDAKTMTHTLRAAITGQASEKTGTRAEIVEMIEAGREIAATVWTETGETGEWADVTQGETMTIDEVVAAGRAR